jgi:hypothetical protein
MRLQAKKRAAPAALFESLASLLLLVYGSL